jgi:uncharacterized protein YggE
MGEEGFMLRWIRAPLILLAFAAAAAAAASPVPDYPFIYAEGSATRDMPPDIATLSVALAARHATSEGAVSAVQALAAKVLALLGRSGVRDADINAAQLNKSLQMRWDEATRRNVPDGFEATRNVSVTVRDLARYPTLLTALLAMPGVNGGGGNFDRVDRGKVSAELVAEAAEAARRNGELMATGLHRKVGAARAIARIPFAEIPQRFGFGGGAVAFSGVAAAAPRLRAMAAEDSSLVPTNITLSESVNVLFELQ